MTIPSDDKAAVEVSSPACSMPEADDAYVGYAGKDELTVRRQGFWDNGLGKIREALAHRFVKSGGVQLMLQAAVGDGLSFDPFSFCQDDRPASEVDVGGSEIVDALRGSDSGCNRRRRP